MKDLGTLIVRASVIAGAILLVVGAWYPEAVLWIIALGVILILFAFGYGLSGGKHEGVPFMVGVLLLIEAVLIDEARTGIKIVSIVIAAMVLIWLFLRFRRRRRPRQQQQNRPHQPQPEPRQPTPD